MAPYWKTYWRRRRQPYRRRRIFRRRARNPFQRRRWRKRRNFFWNKVKRRRFFKKLKKKHLKLKVFQPKTVNACKIKGYKCLFQGSVLRLSHNYIQGIYNQTPEPYPSGGGWSLLVYSLDSLFEDWQHLENIWTKGNAGLPLVRYTGCKFKLYQTENTDYVFSYDNCWPLVDTQYTHADSSPPRMLQKLHKVVVPSRKNQRKRRPYKVIKVRPPPQMTNNWYFAHDIHKIPLVMTTTTSISLTEPFCNKFKNNSNITLHALNPLQFQNPNFQHFNEQLGYSPKFLPIGTISTPIYWYASTQKITAVTKDIIGQLIFLGNTKYNQEGRTIKDITDFNLPNTKANWGNPFFHRFIERTQETSYTIYFSDTTVINMLQSYKTSNPNPNTIKLTEVTGPLIYQLTYNQAKDDGQDNICYLVPTVDQNNMNPTENENLKFHGFPLPILLWGWTDWVKN